MEGLTKKQKAILLFVKNYAKVNGCQPTRVEIGKDSGVSGVAITNQMELLEKKGYIERIGARSIKFLKDIK